ncbi:MAG: hypothetical protein JWP44_887 [Mucilaginibacter sp.]|nr:hypothetical protein [Mucilaginibacter sp.]
MESQVLTDKQVNGIRVVFTYRLRSTPVEEVA